MARSGMWIRVVVLAGALFACSSDPGVAGTWFMETITVSGATVELSPEIRTLAHDVPAWISFDSDGHVTGELPCNSLMGEYESGASDTMSWEVATTAALCLEPAGVMEAEEAMTDLIWTPEVEVSVSDGGLVITGSNVTMTLARYAPTQPKR